jgi:hypothetical protein
MTKSNEFIVGRMREAFELFKISDKYSIENHVTCGTVEVYYADDQYFSFSYAKVKLLHTRLGLHLEVPHNLTLRNFNLNVFLDNVIKELKEYNENKTD